MREEADGQARVERISVGAALHPSPSWQRASEAPNERTVKSIADSFVALLAGKGLGTGLALRSDSSLLRRRHAPGGPGAALLPERAALARLARHGAAMWCGALLHARRSASGRAAQRAGRARRGCVLARSRFPGGCPRTPKAAGVATRARLA